MIEQQLAAAEVAKLKPELSQKAAKMPLPADLRLAVEQKLEGAAIVMGHGIGGVIG